MTGTSLFHEQTAHQRIAAVVDAGSFVELLPPPERLTSPYLAQLGIPVSFDHGIVIGKAKIGGKKVYIAAQVGQFVAARWARSTAPSSPGSSRRRRATACPAP
jgi:malonate decarboxylase beta subunit